MGARQPQRGARSPQLDVTAAQSEAIEQGPGLGALGRARRGRAQPLVGGTCLQALFLSVLSQRIIWSSLHLKG